MVWNIGFVSEGKSKQFICGRWKTLKNGQLAVKMEQKVPIAQHYIQDNRELLGDDNMLANRLR